MYIDLSLKVERKRLEEFVGLFKHNGGITEQDVMERLHKYGHIGTHFDVMDKEFHLKNIITRGKIFDISSIGSGEVKAEDLDLSAVREKDFVMFYSGVLEKHGYYSQEYFKSHPALSDALIDSLIDKKVSFIGVDMTGVKNAKDHPRIDQYCADRGVFIIENLDNLDLLLKEARDKPFKVYTFPVNWHDFSGLPCRVVAEL
jgi:kynurenine formamidase